MTYFDITLKHRYKHSYLPYIPVNMDNISNISSIKSTEVA